MISIIYFYYYLFYTRILPDDQPHLTVVFTLSVSESFLINGIINLICTKFFCYPLNKWMMIGILLLVLLMNYIYYDSNRRNVVLDNKPKLFGSHPLSILITLLFFLISASVMFWGPIFTQVLLHNYCSK